MVRRGEDDALDARLACRLEQIVAADDIGVEDRLPRPLDRKAAQMHDPLYALASLLDLGRLGEIGLDELLIGFEIGRLLQVRDDQAGINRLQQAPQIGADSAGRAGDEYALHVSLRGQSHVPCGHVTGDHRPAPCLRAVGRTYVSLSPFLQWGEGGATHLDLAGDWDIWSMSKHKPAWERTTCRAKPISAT